MLKFNASET